MTEHWRVVTLLPGQDWVIQREHFGSIEAAMRYVIEMRAQEIVREGEKVLVVRDYDRRVYPVWRPNRPDQSSLDPALFSSNTAQDLGLDLSASLPQEREQP